MFDWISAYGITDMENLLGSYIQIFDWKWSVSLTPTLFKGQLSIFFKKQNKALSFISSDSLFFLLLLYLKLSVKIFL